MAKANPQNDFGQGSVARHILSLTIPMSLAQMVNVLYNVVDRMYIGRIPGAGKLALTGVGVTLPVITIVMAFALLYSTGGAPLCSIARGRGDIKEAENIMGTCFTMLVLTGLALMGALYLTRRPLLYLLGASDDTIGYAVSYLSVYLLGSVCVMVSLGMNSFINSQGFGTIGMMTTLIGAVLNLILDPVFIFLFHLGVVGAAVATVLSQTVSALWVLRFLTGERAILKLRRSTLKLDLRIFRRVVTLGLSGFIMAVTNSATQIACNTGLQHWGGDAYVAVMTVMNSVREMTSIPVQGLTSGVQPVIGYNYGAKKYARVREGIRFCSLLGISYTFLAWGLVYSFPVQIIRIFNDDPELIAIGVPAMRMFFMGFFMMAFQFCGQSVFTGLGQSKYAIFFSLFRKIVIVVPLTILLPYVGGLGIRGIYLAEPISNFVGGLACYVTMMLTVYRGMRKEEMKQAFNAQC